MVEHAEAENVLAEGAISFGPFDLYPSRQLLLENGQPVRIGHRALDILIALLEHPGELVRKHDLIKRVWPRAVVEEGTLRVHLVALRKILGDGRADRRFIVNVTGRGYRFVAPTSRTNAIPHAGAAPTHHLPAALTRAIGRAAVLEALGTQLRRKRLVTIVGPGGIGKTTVALAMAEALVTSYRDDVHFVDLAPVARSSLVPSAIAAVLKIAVLSEDPIPALADYVREKQLLLLLDGCEHLLETIAPLAVTLLLAAPGLHILCTSREPLRAEGEGVRRLAPLETPPPSAALSRDDALTFAAVELFVERAKASADDFELTDENAPIVADICRRLDGIALAIEFAAGRLDAFDVRSLAAHLNDRFILQMRGRRVLQRHQTLNATLDWSYELLSDAERVVLRRLSAFVGEFTMEAASAVVSIDGVVDYVADLVGKSLVSADARRASMTYRLLDTTRAYAFKKLEESGELRQCARRHAEFCRDLLTRAEAESVSRPAPEWLAEYASQLDNTRAALDWAFSDDGDRSLGVELTSVAVTLWTHLALKDECRARVRRALSELGPAAADGGRLEMKLFAALVYAGPDAGPGYEAALVNAVAIAERLGDADYARRILSSQWTANLNASDYRAALACAERFHRLAASSADVVDLVVGDRMLGATSYVLGDLTRAHDHTKRALAELASLDRNSHIARFGFDQQASARGMLASIRWTQGFADEAMRLVLVSVDEAIATDHLESLCGVFSVASCPLAYYVGDLATAKRLVDVMLDRLARAFAFDPVHPEHAMRHWAGSWARAFAGVLMKREDPLRGLQALRAAVPELVEPWHPSAMLLKVEYADALARNGDEVQGLALIDSMLVRLERSEETWCLPELLRFKGNILRLRRNTSDATAAEAHFRQAIDVANKQGALAWELRASISCSHLLVEQGRLGEARRLLAPIYERFTEGFETADLVSARSILNELG
jgi:predicted ATPase